MSAPSRIAGALCPRPCRLHRGLRCEHADGRVNRRVETGDHERRRGDEVVAGCGEVAEEASHRDAAGADPRDVGTVGTGDLAGDLDRFLARGDVGVEVPVAVRGGRVAPAHREVREPGSHHVLDEAAVGCEVGDVVLVDLRRDRHQRSGRHGLGLCLVLDQLEDIGAVHDVTGGGGDVVAEPEGAGVDRRRHAAVAADVAGQVAQSCEQAAAARLDGLGQRARVAGQRVRRSQRLDQQRQREPGAFAALGVEVDLVDQSHDGCRVDQVGLHEPAVDRVVGPRRVGEALVALGRLHAAAADRHVGEIGASSESRREHQRRIDGDVPCEAGEGGGHLRAGQADEGVGAEDGWVVAIEQVGGVHSPSPE